MKKYFILLILLVGIGLAAAPGNANASLSLAEAISADSVRFYIVDTRERDGIGSVPA